MNAEMIKRLLIMGLVVGAVPLAANMGLFDKSGKCTITYAVVKAMFFTTLLSTGIDAVLQRMEYAQNELTRFRRLVRMFSRPVHAAKMMTFS